MDSQSYRFGDLSIGDVFEYQDQVYRKENELSAKLLVWVDGQQVDEHVSHRFYPELAVTAASDTANSCQ